MNESQGNAIERAARDYWRGIQSLFGCPREIWLAYAVKVLESLCYFASVLVLMSFLTNDMGLSDTMAGTVFGIFSELFPIYARKPLFGYKVVAIASFGITVLSLVVWVHHMFYSGTPQWMRNVFMVTTMRGSPSTMIV